MIIQVDTREKPKEINPRIIKYFNDNGIKNFRSKMVVGDYQDIESNNRIVIDRKKNLQELCQNIIHEHDRFIREIKKANYLGFKLYFLVEHGDPIYSLPDVAWWVNPRLEENPKATKGETLYKSMRTIERRYGVEFLFCEPQDTGQRIIEILKGEI